MFEYLVKAGVEPIIGELTEQIYQIDSLDKFQHIDHKGRDRGYNGNRLFPAYLLDYSNTGISSKAEGARAFQSTS